MNAVTRMCVVSREFCMNEQLCNNIYAKYLYYNDMDEYCSMSDMRHQLKTMRNIRINKQPAKRLEG